MVKRSSKSDKYARWVCFFPKDPKLVKWKRILKNVVQGGRAHVTFHDVLPHKVELVWATPVTMASPIRLLGLAKGMDAEFQTLGEPVGFQVDETAAVASTDIEAPAAASAEVREAPAAAPEEVVEARAAAPEEVVEAPAAAPT